MKKKMMLIVPMLHQGGFERVCVRTARLMEEYFDVTIVIFDSADIAFDITGLNVVDLNLGVQQGKLGKILNVFKRSVKLRKLKKKIQPQVAYSFGPTANMVNVFSKVKGIKTWIGIRSYMDLDSRVMLKLLVRLADLVICCSKGIKQEIDARYKSSKTVTLYNMFDVQKIQEEAKEPVTLPWNPDETRYLISVGREDDAKAFWHMLRVFACILKKVPDAKLMIVGDGNYSEYKKLAKELKIEDKVCFAGMQKNPYKYISKGDVYLLTSLNEGFPNALVEGMCLGMAAVSVDCKTGPSEILLEQDDTSLLREPKAKGEPRVIWGEYGVLVPCMSRNKDFGIEITSEEENMADVVVRLLTDNELLMKYKSAAVNRAKIFSNESYAEQILDFI